jgi:hypothetical protein
MTSLHISNPPETALERATREYFDSLTAEEMAEENEIAETFASSAGDIDLDQ